jgi:monoamine oxidase
MNRRQFLERLAIAAVTRPAFAATSSDPDVIIVGAGAAGISAARTLREKGLSITIFEALPRLGGRAFTDRAALDVPFDRGAAYLESAKQNALTAIAQGLGFESAPHDPEESVYTGARPGTSADQRAFGEDFDASTSALAAAARNPDAPDSARAAAQTRLGRSGWSETAAAAIAFDDGAELDDLSLRDWNSRNGGEPYLALRDGIGTLIQRLAEGLPVSLATPVTAIEDAPGGVGVVTPKGKLRAKAILLTISPAVLASGAIRFTPRLPAGLEAAAAGLSMGHFEKPRFN